jgi:hypothetical protein
MMKFQQRLIDAGLAGTVSIRIADAIDRLHMALSTMDAENLARWHSKPLDEWLRIYIVAEDVKDVSQPNGVLPPNQNPKYYDKV